MFALKLDIPNPKQYSAFVEKKVTKCSRLDNALSYSPGSSEQCGQ